jgi:ABC-type phosphate transport system substrate-binding protein
LVCSALAAAASAGDVVVIAHPGVEVSGDEVRDIFVGEKQTAGRTKLNPLDNLAAHPDFLLKVIRVDANRYASIWAKKGFRDGIAAPAMRTGDAEVIAAVRAMPGAIGYVSKAPSDVKVVARY